MTSKINHKILILTGKAGQGHISIAKSLVYWTEQWGLEPKMLYMLPGYVNTSYQFNVKTRTFKPVFKLTNNRYLSRLMLVGFNGSLEEKIATFCPDYKNFDIAISTHPLIHPTFAKINIIIIPDPSVHGMYLAPPRPKHYISYWKQDRRFDFLGPLARKGFYDELKYKTKQSLKRESGFNPKKTTVLILAGGEWINRSQDYIDMLGYGFDPEKYEFIFICGKNERFRQEMARQYQETNFQFLGWMDDEQLNKVMRAGDCGLCFSTGSAIVTESGICKLPLYVIDTLGAQEEGYTQILEKHGVGKYVKGGYWEKIDWLKAHIPQTQKVFDKNLTKWSNYLLNRPKEWETFFAKKVLTGK
ncbi:hypothetical protein KKG63_03020 [Patescibacteria group bacterium]|nr:hypothetical protein [Patescibacteria group bacterium]